MKLKELEKYKTKLNRVFKENQVILAYLYGSAAKGKIGPLSDIDIAVLFSKKIKKDDYFDLRIKLAGKISRILKTNKIEIIVCLNEAPPFLKHQAVYSGIPIYVFDNNLKADFELRVLQEYEDFRYHLETSNKIIEEQVRDGVLGKPLISSSSEYLKKYVSN